MLDAIKDPSDLRKCDPADLRQIADELRQETINAVAVTGGHLGAGLGVVELTVALHYVFDTPARPSGLGRRASGLSAQDSDRPPRPHPHAAQGRRPVRFHQARRERIRPVRRGAFVDLDFRRPRHGGGARPRRRDATMSYRVIGDGAMSAGMAYEAMNNAGAMNSRLIVILNDNDMSIAPPVGAMSAYLARLVSGRHLSSLRDIGKQLAHASAQVRWSRRRRAPRNLRAASSPAARCSRSSASTMSARSTGTTSTICCRCCKNVRDAKERADPGSRRHAEGQGLRAGRSVERQVSRRRQVRRRHRHAGQGQGERSVLHQGVRRKPRQGSRARTTASSRSPRPCRPAPASTFSRRRSRTAPSTSASPSSMR